MIEWKDLLILHRKNKQICFFLKEPNLFTLDNILDVEIYLDVCDHDWHKAENSISNAIPEWGKDSALSFDEWQRRCFEKENEPLEGLRKKHHEEK